MTFKQLSFIFKGKMADVATTCAEKSLDDFFAKRDKKKKKEKGKGKEPASTPGTAAVKKNKKEREKTKNENPDTNVEKVWRCCLSTRRLSTRCLACPRGMVAYRAEVQTLLNSWKQFGGV